MAHDTTKTIEEIYLAKLRKKTDVERALMGFSMFETSRYLVKAGISEADNVTTEDLKIAIFNRFYSRDFDQKTRDKIIKHLSTIKREVKNTFTH